VSTGFAVWQFIDISLSSRADTLCPSSHAKTANLIESSAARLYVLNIRIYFTLLLFNRNRVLIVSSSLRNFPDFPSHKFFARQLGLQQRRVIEAGRRTGRRRQPSTSRRSRRPRTARPPWRGPGEVAGRVKTRTVERPLQMAPNV